MENFSRNEKFDMLLIYGEARKNAVAAARLYRERYPNRRHPTRHYFPKLERKLRNQPEDGNRNEFIVSEEKEIDVLALVQVENTISLREIALQCEISVFSAWRILKKYKYRSYKYQLHQHLYPNDQNRRLEYCHWFLERYENDNRFPFKILYTDECRFTNVGMFNRNNKRYWAQENRNEMVVGNFQERFGFNCWMGIMGESMLGPIFFDGNLTGERYLNFLQNEIENFVDNTIPLAATVGMFFQQDGAPPHNLRSVKEYLDDRFQENWIGTNGPIRWPPRSPDLTPLDFFLWGTIKTEVYNTPSATREELEIKVRAAINRTTVQQLRNVVRATIEKVQICQEQNGGHFEHLEP